MSIDLGLVHLAIAYLVCERFKTSRSIRHIFVILILLSSGLDKWGFPQGVRLPVRVITEDRLMTYKCCDSHKRQLAIPNSDIFLFAVKVHSGRRIRGTPFAIFRCIVGWASTAVGRQPIMRLSCTSYAAL